MRLAAVPIRWHRHPEAAAERSGESSRTTHAAERPVDACRLMGAMVSALINGVPFEEVTAPTFWQWGALHPAVADIAAGKWRRKALPAIRGTGYCIDALDAALWSVAGADDFRDAVLRAANLGDDADTTAAITGQLAGARWGASGIPPAWQERLVARERIVALARGLFATGGGEVDDTSWPQDDFVHAWWTGPVRLLAGEYPGHPDAGRARHKLDLLVDAGIRTFVDLTTPAVDTIEQGLTRGAVYVHCWGGVGRTGTVIGCVLADQGSTTSRSSNASQPFAPPPGRRDAPSRRCRISTTS
jgi:hypothetical protein